MYLHWFGGVAGQDGGGARIFVSHQVHADNAALGGVACDVPGCHRVAVGFVGLEYAAYQTLHGLLRDGGPFAGSQGDFRERGHRLPQILQACPVLRDRPACQGVPDVEPPSDALVRGHTGLE